MSCAHTPQTAPVLSTKAAAPEDTRTLAARLLALFEQDQQIVVVLNDAHHRLASANDRLFTESMLDPLGVHHEVHSAFCAYQHASERRRQLALNVGELSQQLTDQLSACGYSRKQARCVNVEELAAGTWQPPTTQEIKR